MPERIVEFLHSIQPAAGGVVMAVLVSALRVVYDKGETRPCRILLESILCGALTLTINSGVIALGFGPEWAVFVGGVTGFLGTFKIRTIAMNFIARKTK
tara:strand:- start:10370 stop:10666 length:297 start_codon:yes stop_codon:yes gene_type:complete